MKNLFSLKCSLELVAAVISLVAILGVLQTFIIGKHFVIPTMILIIAVLFGNLSFYGQRGETWAKYILFWMGFIFSCYTFFALFWAQKFRVILGDSFEFIWTPLVLVTVFLVYQYYNKNKLFKN